MPNEMPPQCRKKAQAEGFGYSRSACQQCGWRVLQGSLDVMCNEPMYMLERTEYPDELLSTEEKAGREYKNELMFWVNTLIDGTGLNKEDPEMLALLLAYTVIAKYAPDTEVDQELIHDIWALWTLVVRRNPQHKHLVPYDKLDERYKALDKIDMWAIQSARDICG